MIWEEEKIIYLPELFFSINEVTAKIILSPMETFTCSDKKYFS